MSRPDPAPAEPPSPSAEAGWKPLLALLCLSLSALLWFDGLAGSLQRPSVGDDLSLRQLRLAVLSEEAVPETLRPWLVGDAPRSQLAEQLRRQEESEPRGGPTALQRLERALLDRSTGQVEQADGELRALMEVVEPVRRPLLEALLGGGRVVPGEQDRLLDPWQPPLLVRQLGCEQLGGPEEACPAAGAAGRLFARLLAVSLLPLLLLLPGIALLLRLAWLAWRGRLPAAPPLVGPPLSGVEATLLIAGGFVLLGEVATPELLQPLLVAGLQRWQLPPALAQGIQVVTLYLGLMAAPLTLLWLLLRRRPGVPPGGWLQWHWRPLAGALRQAAGTLLMVLPLVAVSGWLIERLLGDPGGSNPLLELVLTSSDARALLCFTLTATVLAPLFEETIFRGVLLPVLGRYGGGAWSVLGSAAVFALAHLSLGELVPLFVLGLGLGWVRWRSGRLGAAVLLHALWNGLTLTNLLLLAG